MKLSYQVNNRGVVVCQPPQGWVVLTTDNPIIRRAMHPKISRFYEAIWSAGSGRNSCRYKLQLDSGITPLLVLHSKQLGNSDPYRDQIIIGQTKCLWLLRVPESLPAKRFL